MASGKSTLVHGAIYRCTHSDGSITYSSKPPNDATNDSDASDSTDTTTVNTTDASTKSTYVRLKSAPNGSPWPMQAGYVHGYPRTSSNGLSIVTVDNKQNDSDVFVKLVSIDSDRAYPIRQFYIPAHDIFTVKKVNAGSYDIRYRDLSTGHLSRTQSFSLDEIPTDGGTQYSEVTMTLYKVQHGNMQTYDLAENEF
jgi:hypothetical protein